MTKDKDNISKFDVICLVTLAVGLSVFMGVLLFVGYTVEGYVEFKESNRQLEQDMIDEQKRYEVCISSDYLYNNGTCYNDSNESIIIQDNALQLFESVNK